MKNLPASIRQRLLNISRQQGRAFDEITRNYTMERFLYRLSQSPYANQFVLKGALALRIWDQTRMRPTRDIDMLGRVPRTIGGITEVVQEISRLEVAPDGLQFDPNSVRCQRILVTDKDYFGVRAKFNCRLTSARIQLQMDIGFEDGVYPEPEMRHYPTILDAPAPHILCYRRESSIAEKLHAMATHGLKNDRMRDFYDIWVLAQEFDFDAVVLAEAVQRTFAVREEPVPTTVAAFTDEYINGKQHGWDAFCRRSDLPQAPADLAEVMAVVESFLAPILEAVSSGQSIQITWSAATAQWR